MTAPRWALFPVALPFMTLLCVGGILCLPAIVGQWLIDRMIPIIKRIQDFGVQSDTCNKTEVVHDIDSVGARASFRI